MLETGGTAVVSELIKRSADDEQVGEMLDGQERL